MQIKMDFLALLMFIVSLVLSTNSSAKDYSSWIKRCEPYRNVVERILDKENVSREYYFLMVAESNCAINAVSHKGAKGFWQLMPSTSTHYGCSNPNDLECATKAAARYIKKLSGQFRTFDEVIAAYNMGGHNLSRRKKMTEEAMILVARVNAIKEQDTEEKENGKKSGIDGQRD